MVLYVVPGAEVGYAVVTDRLLAVFDSSVSTELLQQLWQGLEADALLEDVLSLIAEGGVSRMPSFALLELVDPATGTVSIAVRGEAIVEFADTKTHRYDGASARTWVEGHGANVREAWLSIGEPRPDAETLPVEAGIVPTAQIAWMAPSPTAARRMAKAGSHAKEEAVAEPGTDANAAAGPVLAATVEVPALPASLMTAPLAVPPAQEVRVKIPPKADEPEAGDLDERTTVSTSARAKSIKQRLDDLLGEEDETTVMGVRKPQATYLLRFDDGRNIPLNQVLVFGRAPKTLGRDEVRAERLPSPSQEVSSTHAELHVQAGELLVRDLASTNGTRVTLPAAQPRLLRGEEAAVPLGTVIDFGDGNRAEFSRA